MTITGNFIGGKTSLSASNETFPFTTRQAANRCVN